MATTQHRQGSPWFCGTFLAGLGNVQAKPSGRWRRPDHSDPAAYLLNRSALYLSLSSPAFLTCSAHIQFSSSNTSQFLPHTHLTMANTKFYIPLGTQAAAAQKPSRRPPLTPSTVSSPCLNTHAPIAARRDSGSGSPTKASLLLAKVASGPSTPRRDSASSPQSPHLSTAEMASSPLYTPHDQRPAMWRSESARYWSQEKQGM